MRLFLFFFILTKVFGIEFGYISYTTLNIGDDIQSIAAMQFLPDSAIPIDRDIISDFTNNSIVDTIVNGYYMNKKDNMYHWPPSAIIRPLLISVHFTKAFLDVALSSENLKFLLQNAPIGARDYFTLSILQKNNIPCYFSGCLTLTLKNTENERNDIVYAVDLDKECEDYLKSITQYPVEHITHLINKEFQQNQLERKKIATCLLKKYMKARFVVTSRLHAALPCLAFNTPVLLINTQKDQYRFEGLKELVHNCNKKEFLVGDVDFDLNSPPNNLTTYIPIRSKLIQIINDWRNACAH